MIQALMMVGSCLAALVVLLVWAPQPEHRARHADAGVGTLTVWHIRAQIERDRPEEPILWPTTDPDADAPDVKVRGDRYPPGTAPAPTGWATPTPEHLRRVLDGLRCL